MNTADISLLLRSIEQRDTISADEREALKGGPWRVAAFAPETEIVAEGSRPLECCLLLSGLAGRTLSFEDGRRQITALQVPGDFVDLHGFLLRVMDHNVVALSSVQAAFIPHAAMHAITTSMPHLSHLLWLLTLIEGAIQRNWIASLGRRSALQRLAHLVCELHERLRIVGLGSGMSFHLPLNQAQVADMLGLSTVHMNRSLQELRASGAVRWERGRVTITDWVALGKMAEFDPNYLNLRREPR